MTTLIIGATGKQGRATAHALLAARQPIRVLVRDPEAPAAVKLAAAGAELVRGDLDDSASLVAAATGATAVFSIPYPDLSNLDGDAELTPSRNLVHAAKLAGVSQFVHSSVAGAGDFSHPGWQEEGRWGRHYWDSKWAIEELVRGAGFAAWTVLRRVMINRLTGLAGQAARDVEFDELTFMLHSGSDRAGALAGIRHLPAGQDRPRGYPGHGDRWPRPARPARGLPRGRAAFN